MSDNLCDEDRKKLRDILEVLESTRGGGMLLQKAITAITEVLTDHVDFRGWRFFRPSTLSEAAGSE